MKRFSAPVLAAGVILLAVLGYGMMNRYESVSGTPAVVDRWTGEMCAQDRCWKNGLQTTPPTSDPLSRLRTRAAE